MNNHVIDYLRTKGAFITNLYILSEISHDTYIDQLNKYNDRIKKECDLSLEYQLNLGKCQDYNPLFDGVRIERD